MKTGDRVLVFSDGCHNAFTDIGVFEGRYYLVFRSGKSHISYDGRILACVSLDGINWNEPMEIANTPTDDRDPKLFVFDSKLFCTFQTRWASECNPHRRFPMVAYTSDGVRWSQPSQCYDDEYVPWRPKLYKGNVYNAFYKHSPDDPSTWRVVLGVSYNGLWWNYVSTIYRGDRANETELHFAEDDTLMAVIRREGMSSIAAWSSPPYKDWAYEDLGVSIHSPCIKQLGNILVVCGREYDYDTASTGVSMWRWDKRSRLVKITELEPLVSVHIPGSDRRIDCGYPGLQEMISQPRDILISYYHGNNCKSDIYTVRMSL